MGTVDVFKTFYAFLLKDKLLFVIFLVLLISSNILFNINPYFYSLFVSAIPELNEVKLFNLLYIFLGLRVLGVILDALSFIVGDQILFEAAKNARVKIFDHVGRLDFEFHTSKSTGSLISAFKRGDGAFFSFFHDIHVRIVGILVNFGVMVYFLSQLNFLITVLVGLSLLLSVVATRFLVGYNVKKRSEFNDEEDKISGIITDNLINFETVKLFAKEKWENDRLMQTFKPWVQKLWGYGNSFRLIDLTMGAIINISIFAILYFTIKDAVSLKFNIADFVLVTGLLSGFYPRLWELVWSTRDLAKNYTDIVKYFSLLNYNEKVNDPVQPIIIDQSKIKGQIEFVNVNHSYKGGTKNAVADFNLKINAGQSVAFVGKSGSGKTTITKLLMRFFDPQKGKILIDGIDIKSLTKEDLRSMFGVVPQEAILFNNTIRYNIAYGSNKNSLKEVKEAAKMANISDFIESLPKKYETNVGERGIKLSGGQKQRLAIARMIMSKPKIIIFDEATSHLDSESEKLIQDAFWKYSKDKTTIIIAHRLSTISKADKIVVMDKGKIIQTGKHIKLIAKNKGLYKKLWGLQDQS